ncbi:MAG: hypothetical protein ABR517_03240 [Thermoanaerobaculia bacterium]
MRSRPAEEGPLHEGSPRRLASRIAAELVVLAAGGDDGDLQSRLTRISTNYAWRGIEELAAFYLFVAQKSVPGHLNGAAGESADSFLEMLWEETWANLATVAGTQTFAERASFAELWYRRKHQYAARERMYRREGEALDGTVIFELYDNLRAVGDEIRVEVLAAIQLERLFEVIAEVFGAQADPS